MCSSPRSLRARAHRVISRDEVCGGSSTPSALFMLKSCSRFSRRICCDTSRITLAESAHRTPGGEGQVPSQQGRKRAEVAEVE